MLYNSLKTRIGEILHNKKLSHCHILDLVMNGNGRYKCGNGCHICSHLNCICDEDKPLNCIVVSDLGLIIR